MGKIYLHKIEKGDSGEESRIKIYDNDTALRSKLEHLDAQVKQGALITLKGTMDNEQAIKALPAPEKGDTYMAKDTGNFWVWDAEEEDWINIGAFLPRNIVTTDTLYNVSQQTGNYAFADKQAARNDVPTEIRSHGQIIAYHIVGNLGWVTEQYIGQDVEDWDTESNWKEIGLQVSQTMGQDTDKAPSLKLFADEMEKKNSEMAQNKEEITQLFGQKSAEIDCKLAQQSETLIAKIATKADGCYLNDENKLQLTSEGSNIGTPIELASGIINLSYKQNKEYNSPEAAREAVKNSDRIIGQIITYKLAENIWYLDQFTGSTSNLWDNSGSWVQYVLKGDLTSILLDIDNLKVTVDSLSSSVSGKADGIETDDVDESNMAIVLTSNGSEIGRVTVPKGGNGSGGPSTGVIMKMKSISPSSIVVSKGEDSIVKFNWTSVDTTDDSPTGAGAVSVLINDFPVYSADFIQQGDNEINLKKYVADGANIVKVRVTDSYQNYRTLTYTVQVASLILTSRFADTQFYESEPVDFPYTVQGYGNKTIRYWLNGIEQASDSTDSARKDMTKKLTGLVSGTNSLLAVAESNVVGYNLKSNELYHEFIYKGSTLGKPAIVISYNKTQAEQFSIINIPYLVYDPANENAKVDLLINGVVRQKLTVGRTRQTWSYLVQEQGTLKMEIRCGATSKSIEIEIIASEYDITEETANLKYKASAIGKTNAADDRNSWKYGDYNAVFDNFTWNDDGWQRDADGNSHLRLISDSNLTVNINPFSGNVLQEGMTLTVEFATEDVIDTEATIMSCFKDGIGIEVKPNYIRLKSAQTELTANLDSSTKVSVSFVIQQLNENRLMLLFVDGIMSGAIQYSSTDNFSQTTAAGFNVSTGNKSCITLLYNLRWYNTSLNYNQIFNNYLFDIENLDKKTEKFEFNDILDEYGNVDYAKSLNFLPCLTFVGELPTVKGSKKDCEIVYVDKKNPSLSFTATNVKNDVQGTSSQAYPRKNYKFKLGDGVVMTQSGERRDKYSMLNTQIETDVFCMKADFAESSGTHNTGYAILADEALRKLNYTIPPQAINEKVRTTVFGYPCLVFQKDDEASPAKFIGKYNFNDDKASTHVFGFSEGCECWEFKNNTSDICLFKSADWNLTGTDDMGNTIPAWLNDLEGRYPDGHEDASNLKPLYDWVLSCIGNPSKFKAECKYHFNEKWLVFYCLTTEMFGAVDQRAKNQMLTTYGERGETGDLIWYFIYYDNDTILGINNEGSIAFGYDIETQDKYGDATVWNGANSELWKLVETCYQSEMAELYNTLISNNAMSLKSALEIFQDRQADKWSETIYNQDGYYKYIDPLVSDGKNEYLYALQGSRSRHRIWWLTNRFNYLSGKYFTGEYKQNMAHIRVNTPEGILAVPAEVKINVTLSKPMYVRAKIGSYDVNAGRGEAGKTYTLIPPTQTYNNTEGFIYGAAGIKSFGDLSPCYPGKAVSVSEATALEDLIIGNTKTGYANNILDTLTLGNNTRLREINVANCKVLKQSLELGKCYSIKKVEARGSAITGVALPQKGILEELYLPATVTSIYLKNQPYMQKLLLEGYANINSVVIENTANVDGYKLVKDCVSAQGSKLSKVRLIDINASDIDSKAMMFLINNNIDAEISGKLYLNTASSAAIATIRNTFPLLALTIGLVTEEIEFADSIVKAKLVSVFDTDNDGELTKNEIKTATLTSGLLSGINARSFIEAHLWGGTPSVINLSDTLEAVSMRTGISTIKDLPNLKRIDIFQGESENLQATPKLINALTNCYSLKGNTWNLINDRGSGYRYIFGANGGSILGRINTNNGQYYQLCYILDNRANLVINEPCLYDDAIEATYPFGINAKTLVFNQLISATLKHNKAVNRLDINGLGWDNGVGATIYIGKDIPVNLTVNISNTSGKGSGRLSSLIAEQFSTTNKVDVYISDDVSSDADCKIGYTDADSRNNNSDVFGIVDLGKNINGTITTTDYESVGYIRKLIIRNETNLLGLSLYRSSSYSRAFVEIYVPDALVNAYKVATNWSKYTNQIKPLSLLA